MHFVNFQIGSLDNVYYCITISQSNKAGQVLSNITLVIYVVALNINLICGDCWLHILRCKKTYLSELKKLAFYHHFSVNTITVNT